jgi:hypothetical protein
VRDGVEKGLAVHNESEIDIQPHGVYTGSSYVADNDGIANRRVKRSRWSMWHVV